MTCNTFTLNGLNNACKPSNLNGIREIYVAPYANTHWTIDTGTNTIKPYVDRDTNVVVYKFPRNNECVLTTTYNQEQMDYTSELTIYLNKLATDKHQEYLGLSQNAMAVICRDYNNHYWFLGKDDYVMATSGEVSTGTQRTDKSQYTLVLSCSSFQLPYEVLEADVEDFYHDWNEEYVEFRYLSGEPVQIGFYVPEDVTNFYSFNIEYSYDKQEWTEINWLNWDEILAEVSESVPRVYFRGTNPMGIITADEGSHDRVAGFYYSGDGYVSVGGNVLSLISPYPAEFSTMEMPECSFYELFGSDSDVFKEPMEGMEVTQLVDASNLVLSSSIVPAYGYSAMFQDCINLIYPPQLPATYVRERGYWAMFLNCSSLEYTPVIEATTLGNYACSSMFSDCVKLFTLNDVKATTIGEYTFQYMFSDCTRIQRSFVINVDTVPRGACVAMFTGCGALNRVTIMAIDGITTDNFDGWLDNTYGGVVVSRNVSTRAMWAQLAGTTALPDRWSVG